MRPPRSMTWPRRAARRLRPRNWTIRVRLTVLYGAMFLAAGTALLGLTYLMVLHSLDVGPRSGGNLVRIDTEAGIVLSPAGDAADAPERIRDQLAEANGRFVRERGAYEQTVLARLLTRGAVALGLVGVAGAGCGWVLAGRALRPVHAITATARRIGRSSAADGQLRERIALAGPPDEIKELADTFDDMLDRLSRSFSAQRRFVANASHELRTPLVINRAVVEAAMSRPGAAESTKDLGRALLAVNDRHQHLIDGILMLAQSERELTRRIPVDLADIAEYAVDVTEAQAAAASVTPALVREPALTRGDPTLLEHLVLNLVTNAVRHNLPVGGWLRVRTATEPDGAVSLVVSNSGRVVPADQTEQLFEPFRRLGTDRTGAGGGAGLGLSIARTIARAHDGDVTARPRAGGGLTVLVTLPGAAPVSG